MAAVARMSAAWRNRYLKREETVNVILLWTENTKEVKMTGLRGVMSFSGLMLSS